MRIWIDTDVGGDIDDALALLLAMSDSRAQVAGVSTVFENTKARAQIAKTLLTMGDLCGIPVYAGRGTPRRARSVFDDPVDEAILPKTYIPEVFSEASVSGGGVEALAAALMREPLTVVTLGALTNIAELIEKYPAAAARIHRLYIMGGAQKLNINEFNFSCDPESTQVVLASRIPKYIVTLDVTFHCKVEGAQLSRLCACRSATVRTVLDMSALWKGGMILHDPLTLACALDDSFVTFAGGDMIVETEGAFSRGKCVDLCDFNWRRKPRGDMFISQTVRAKAFTDYYVDTVCAFDARLALGGVDTNLKNKTVING